MSDLINREDAIEAVVCHIWHMPNEAYRLFNCENVVRDVVEDAIKRLPSAEAETKWIPCSERLPDAEYGEGDLVMCCTETGLMYILYWNGGNWCVPTGEPHEWVNHKTGWHDKVIAWMPLPKPYKGGDTE